MTPAMGASPSRRPGDALVAFGITGDLAKEMTCVEEAWRILEPLLDAPPPVVPYVPGSWGREAADDLVADHGGWRGPWTH